MTAELRSLHSWTADTVDAGDRLNSAVMAKIGSCQRLNMIAHWQITVIKANETKADETKADDTCGS